MLSCSGARKLTDEFNSMMNSKVEYRKKNTTLGSILLLKARELAQYLVGKRKTIEFIKPADPGKRDDIDIIFRNMILAIGYTEWSKMEFSKGTPHYMKKNAEDDKPFTLNAYVNAMVGNVVQVALAYYSNAHEQTYIVSELSKCAFRV